MHAKRRQLILHFKARLLQIAYRAHLNRVRQRSLPAVAAPAIVHDALQPEESKTGFTFQQKRLPSKAIAIRNRKSVALNSGTSNTAMPAAAAVGASAAASSQIIPPQPSNSAPLQQPLLPSVPEPSPLSSRARRLSM
jgi:hypothetical protein